jgi:predicted transcriptional regulator
MIFGIGPQWDISATIWLIDHNSYDFNINKLSKGIHNYQLTNSEISIVNGYHYGYGFSEGTAPLLGKVLYAYDSQKRNYTIMNITNNERISEFVEEIEIYGVNGNTIVLDGSTCYLRSFNSDGYLLGKINTSCKWGYDIEIFDDLGFVLSQKNIKIINLSTLESHDLYLPNITYDSAFEINRNNGLFYIGTDNGIIQFDLENNKSLLYPLEGLSNYSIYDITIDEINDLIYLSTYNGLFKFHLSNRTYEFMGYDNDIFKVGVHYNSNSTVFIRRWDELCLELEGFPDTSTLNSFYIDQVNNKLFTVTGRSAGRSLTYRGYPSMYDLPPPPSVFADQRAYGLIIYDFDKRTFINYSIDQGLPNEICSGLAVDTKRGLVHISGERFYTVLNLSIHPDDIKRNVVTPSVFNHVQTDNIDGNREKSLKDIDIKILQLSIISTILISILIVYSFILIEPTKYKLLTYFAGPYFTRLKKEKVLDHETRGRIRGMIESEPSINYNDLKKKLRLNNGTLSYHLRVLEREELIRSKNSGLFKHFFPIDMKLPRKIYRMNDIQKIIFKKLMETPGMSQKELAEGTGSKASTISYNIKAMAQKGIITVKREGNETKCFIILENGNVEKPVDSDN